MSATDALLITSLFALAMVASGSLAAEKISRLATENADHYSIDRVEVSLDHFDTTVL